MHTSGFVPRLCRHERPSWLSTVQQPSFAPQPSGPKRRHADAASFPCVTLLWRFRAEHATWVPVPPTLLSPSRFLVGVRCAGIAHDNKISRSVHPSFGLPAPLVDRSTRAHFCGAHFGSSLVRHHGVWSTGHLRACGSDRCRPYVVHAHLGPQEKRRPSLWCVAPCGGTWLPSPGPLPAAQVHARSTPMAYAGGVVWFSSAPVSVRSSWRKSWNGTSAPVWFPSGIGPGVSIHSPGVMDAWSCDEAPAGRQSGPPHRRLDREGSVRRQQRTHEHCAPLPVLYNGV